MFVVGASVPAILCINGIAAALKLPTSGQLLQVEDELETAGLRTATSQTHIQQARPLSR